VQVERFLNRSESVVHRQELRDILFAQKSRHIQLLISTRQALRQAQDVAEDVASQG